MTRWRVAPAVRPDKGEEGDASTVPLKWAHDAATGAPRYIHDPEVVGKAGNCICPACELVLTPVLAGQPMRVRPTAHFRHPAGALRDACVLVAARAAAVRHFAERGFIDLPRRTMSARAQGFSGQDYEVWAEEPAEQVRVSSARMHDHATAVLTLDDGRELTVDLTGTREPMADGSGRAVVTIALSDPALAMLDADAIRARLRVLPDMRWCSHWNEQDLVLRNRTAAQSAVSEALDGWGDDDEAEFLSNLPDDMAPSEAQAYRRETLLHREAKAALEAAEAIETPGLEVIVTRHPPEELAGDWDDQTIRKVWLTGRRRLELDEVCLERRLGRIVPDVIATLGGRQIYTHGGTLTGVGDEFDEDAEDGYAPAWPPTLLIEVKVTHGIDDEKLRRIRQLDMPTLEIDLGSLGGRLSREQFRDLVVNQIVGKRWVHHPALAGKRRVLESEIDEHPVCLEWAQRMRELNRPRWLAEPAEHWVSAYLSAATRFHDRCVQIRRAQRTRNPSDAPVMVLGPEDVEWQDLAAAAEALDSHGLPGGMDREMISDTGLVPRILSIRHNRGIGYAVDSGFQVLNAIMQSGEDNRRWHTLYTIAVKAYGLALHFSEKQAGLYAAWRQLIVDRVEAVDETYLRPGTYDATLSALFPEMAARIATGYGLSKTR